MSMSTTDFYHALAGFAYTFPQMDDLAPTKPLHFANGLPFVVMLADCGQIQIELREFERDYPKWINRVGSLRRVLARVKGFLDRRMLGTEKIQEIDVVEIAKNASQEHLVKFFQVVMTVLMASQQKEAYIQRIMSLEQSIQKTFVEIIKRATHGGTVIPQQNSTILGLEQQLRQIRRENDDLQSQVSQLSRKNKHLQKEVRELRDKLISIEEDMEAKKTTDHSMASDDLQYHNDKQRMLIQNLKMKLLATVREGEGEVGRLREELVGTQSKLENLEEVQSMLQQYKELYNQALIQLQKMGGIQKEKRKYMKMCEDKDVFIKKLQNRFQNKDGVKEHQTKDKKHVPQRFLKRLKSEPTEIETETCEYNSIEDQRDEISYLEEELMRARQRLKEFQKESIKNRKKFNKIVELQKQKKRLERVVNEVNRSKDAEIEMLVVSLSDLRDQNIKMFELIRERKFGKH